MQLFHSPASPFVRKVVVTLHETGQTGDVEFLAVATTPVNSAPEILAHNPTGKIPALTRPDGPALYDSRVICRYLDARAGGKLYPESRIWDTLTLEATADAIMDAAVLMIYERRIRPVEKQSDDWIEAQWGKVARAIGAVNTRWMSHLNGPLDMGQISIGCALGYLDFRHEARDWRIGNDALAKWYETFALRPAMQATKPD
ncbi:glutathione S-transferase [Oceaniovalibus sp. ACAM 378]|jgi:glutathione S-transferase|uniref:glutathione S-transferase n=1 Tax=Oceaniovalibus sp. ACAM 378 TaxID=2599923 RepID=UPI0011D526E5|nr:glutathione S-transferase [Oceaniovalibus sp. ACAM 378]TYB90702.1 glutathione S-transferase [Oceaniovalibus sp. ACAM 378]